MSDTYRARICGATHPHYNAIGTVDPAQSMQRPDGGPEMVKMTFDEPSHGVEAAYVSVSELERH